MYQTGKIEDFLNIIVPFCKQKNTSREFKIKLENIKLFVIDRFNQGSFSKQNLVGNTHQEIFHVVLDLGGKLYVVKEKVLEQCSPDDISLLAA